MRYLQPPRGRPGQRLQLRVAETRGALVVAEGGGPLVDLVVVGDQEAPLAAGQGLARHDRHRSHVSDRTEEPPLVQGPLGMGDILHYAEPVLAGDLHDRVHVGGVPAVVDGQDRPGALGDPVLDVVRVEGEGLRVDLGEDHGGAEGVDLQARAPEGHALADDLVPPAHAGGPQGRVDGRGPRVVTQDVARLEPGGQLGLEEVGHVGARHRSPAQDLQDRRLVLPGDDGPPEEVADLRRQRFRTSVDRQLHRRCRHLSSPRRPWSSQPSPSRTSWDTEGIRSYSHTRRMTPSST